MHYETLEAAETAIANVNGMLLNDLPVYVGLHASKRDRDSKIEEIRSNFTNIYVKNVDASINAEEFEKMFAEFGEIGSCSLNFDEDGKSKYYQH